MIRARPDHRLGGLEHRCASLDLRAHVRQVRAGRNAHAHDGDAGNQRYTRLNQIAPANFSQLKVGWEWSGASFGDVLARPIPIYVGGKLITVAGDRRYVVALDAARDPLGAEHPRATDKWRSAPANRPEEQLVGVMYAGDPVDGDIVVAAPEHWVFADTGLTAGAVLPGLLGYEVDCVHGHAPAATQQILAASPWQALNNPELRGVAHMTCYTSASGATVFAAGSIQWAWGLDDFNAPALRAARLHSGAQQMTHNVLRRFLSS